MLLRQQEQNGHCLRWSVMLMVRQIPWVMLQEHLSWHPHGRKLDDVLLLRPGRLHDVVQDNVLGKQPRVCGARRTNKLRSQLYLQKKRNMMSCSEQREAERFTLYSALTRHWSMMSSIEWDSGQTGHCILLCSSSCHEP